MRLHVAADDRTGALEVAAALADRHAGGLSGVVVDVWPASPIDDVVVIDLESRHRSLDDACARASALPSAGPCAHKIDSTLRGNWAGELVARAHAASRAVLVVPALPALGRTCEGGTVLLGGRPVHETDAGADVRRVVSSSRPADHLTAAGAGQVHELASIDDVTAWLSAPVGVAVADAADGGDIDAIASAWGGDERTILAGTSAAIGAVAGPVMTVLAGSIPGPVLVVCGSATDGARRQIEFAVAAGAVTATDDSTIVAALRSGRHAIVAASPPTAAIGDHDADAIAAGLAARARVLMQSTEGIGALMVLGGDTAAAVLGRGQVLVLGSVAPGTAWVDSPDFEVPVITRAGAFGDDRALAGLLKGTLRT